VALTLQQADFDRLKVLADDFNLDIGEVIQRAIATALFLQDEIDERSRILIRRRDGSQEELVLPY
jgi:hypothetical protein